MCEHSECFLLKRKIVSIYLLSWKGKLQCFVHAYLQMHYFFFIFNKYFRVGENVRNFIQKNFTTEKWDFNSF